MLSSSLLVQPQRQHGQLPSILTRLSGLINNPNAQGGNEDGQNNMALLAPLARFQQALQTENGAQDPVR